MRTRNRRALAASTLFALAACGGEPAADLSSICAEGTVARGGRCESIVTCGAGTVARDGQCVAAVSCGEGTVESEGRCVPADGGMTCGAGTLPVGNACYVDATACAPGTTLENGRCVPSGTSLTCGTDTRVVGSRCVGTVLCGSGTSRIGDECRASQAACGANTTFQNGVCVGQAASTLTCGTNTAESAGQCRVAPGACGPGTVLANGVCVLASQTSAATQFAARAGLTKSFVVYRDQYRMSGATYEDDYPRFLLTDMPQSQADSSIGQDVQPIGTGAALIVSAAPFASSTASFDRTFAVTAGTTSCASRGFMPRPADANTTYVTYATWAGGQFTPAQCAVRGTVRFVRTFADQGNVRIDLNVEFADGTAITNASFTRPYAETDFM